MCTFQHYFVYFRPEYAKTLETQITIGFLQVGNNFNIRIIWTVLFSVLYFWFAFSNERSWTWKINLKVTGRVFKYIFSLSWSLLLANFVSTFNVLWNAFNCWQFSSLYAAVIKRFNVIETVLSTKNPMQKIERA